MLGGIRVPGLEQRRPHGGNARDPFAEGGAPAGAAGGEPTSKELKRLLVRAKVPVLDTSMFAPGARARLRRPRLVKTLIDSMVTMRRVRERRTSTRSIGEESKPRLDLSRLSDAELQSVLWYLARQAGWLNVPVPLTRACSCIARSQLTRSAMLQGRLEDYPSRKRSSFAPFPCFLSSVVGELPSKTASSSWSRGPARE